MTTPLYELWTALTEDGTEGQLVRTRTVGTFTLPPGLTDEEAREQIDRWTLPRITAVIRRGQSYPRPESR